VAQATLATLRAARKQVDDFKNLRQEVSDLLKEGRELSKSVDDLKQQLQTQTNPALNPTTKPTKAATGKT
jgi:uncharacterized protein YlxW (UPF0749 family)